MIHKYKILLIGFLFLVSNGLLAQENSKVLLDKSYPAKGESLSIKNSFGNVTVSTWNKNEYKVTVELITDGLSDKEWANLLQKVEIDQSQDNGEIQIRTEWSNQNINTKSGQSFEVNYQISCPKSAQLDLTNSFGNLSVADMDGKIEIDEEYGNLTAGNLAHADIELSFGKGTIESVEKGDLTFKYADKVTINHLGSIDLESGFSHIKVNTADNIDFEGKYGSIEFKSLNNLDGSVGFSSMEIGQLNYALDLEAKYVGGKLYIKNVGKDFKSIDIDSKFSQVELNFDPASSFKFHTEHKFGNLKKSSALQMTTANEEDFSAEFEGYYGSQGASANVHVTTSYGDLRIDIN